MNVETVPLAPSPPEYKHEWVITIKADSQRGAMDAVWECWEAWKNGSEPIGGACPAAMGNRQTYHVNKPSAP